MTSEPLYIRVIILFNVDLRVTYSPRDPRFAGSNPAEVGEFFQDSVKDFKSTAPSLRFQAG